ncbi:MAG: arylsulfatase [Halioglobus sp.]|nr:arylsulfatase [Halioglobus sp.]
MADNSDVRKAPVVQRALLWLVTALCALPLAAREPPNIVLIVADDIGYSDLGAFGGEIRTPNIDALAGAGMRFANFHAASSCAPTRAMLLTGVDNHLAGIGSMRELMPFSHRGKPGYDGVLNERVETVASLLQSAGYRTLVAGKWHLGTSARNLPPARGFDHSFIQADSGSDNFEMRPYLPMQAEANWYANGERLESLPADFYSSSAFVDEAIAFLASDTSASAPFFAYLAFQANHTPLQAPAAFVDVYRGHYTEGWARVREARLGRLRELGLLSAQATVAPGPSQAQWDALPPQQQYFEARRMQAYAGMATAMDSEIGRFIAHLRASGEYDNTVFVLLSDNGATVAEPYDNPHGRRWLEKHYHRDVETLGERGSWVAAGRHWGVVSNTPLAGSKFSASEGGVRVPLIIAGVPAIEPGSVYGGFVYVTDIAPTLLAIAGVEGPSADSAQRERISGRSLLPVLAGADQPLRGADDTIGYEFSGNAALYRGQYKLVRNQPPAGDRQWRLHNIMTDPGETQDLSQRLPDVHGALQEAYAQYAAAAGVLPMPENYELATQVARNALVFVFLPRYLPYLGGALLLIAALLLAWRYRAGRA